jgi:hypothetical protein
VKMFKFLKDSASSCAFLSRPLVDWDRNIVFRQFGRITLPACGPEDR